MMNVKRTAAISLPRRRRFWMVNGLLLLLYFWTLTETITISISVQPHRCTAHTPERTLGVDCSQLYRGFLGLYSSSDPVPDYLDSGPLDWLAPASAWKEISVVDSDSGSRPPWRDSFYGSLNSWQAVHGVWRTRLGELRPPSRRGLIVQRNPLPDASEGTFQVHAQLRRPYDNAGLVLMQPDGRNGWAFIATASERRGVWWRWEDGRLGEPIAGIPFQKPPLAQFQSLLRRILIAHQVALLIMALAWVARTAFRPYAKRRGWPPAVRFNARRLQRKKCLLVGITLLTFGLTLHIAVDILERIPHVQDSVTYLFQAKTLARGALSAPAPPSPQAFAQEFLLVRDGRWFGKYPPGYPALLALGILAGAPWLINPLLATVTVPLIYAAGRRLYPGTPVPALLAAALPLASPFFLFMSGSHMAHPAELFWMALLMALWLRALHSPRSWRLAIGAGLAFGFLFLTRQLSAVAGALPFLAITSLWSLYRRRSAPLLTVLRPALVAGLAALPFLFLLFAHQWALTGDPWQDPRLLFWEYDHLGFGQDIGEGQNAFELTMTPQGLAQVWYDDPSQPPRGHSLARGLYNTHQNWLALERDLFAWLPALTFSFIWFVFLLQAPRRQDWALILVFLALLGAYVFYWADGVSYGPRYFYVALPALLLLTARGVQLLSRWLGREGSLVATGLLLLLICGAYIVAGPSYVDEYSGYNFISRHTLSLIEEEAQTPALIFVDPGLDWWSYGEVFSANSPWLDGPLVVARNLGPRANRRLMQHFPERYTYLFSRGTLHQLREPRTTRPLSEPPIHAVVSDYQSRQR